MSRFSNLEIDDVPAAPTAPAMTQVVTDARGQALEPAAPVKVESIDAEGRARAVASQVVADRHGLFFPEATFFAWGTPGQWGDKAAAARRDFHQMMLFTELLARAHARTLAEGRRADVIGIDALTYGVDDRLRTRPGTVGAPMTPQSLRQLLGRVGAEGHAGAYLTQDALPGALRAPHVQHWIDRAKGGSKEVKILSKNGDGTRHVYGVVGPKYPIYGMDEVMRDVGGAIPREARGSLTYDASTTRWRVEAMLNAEFEPVVGDLWRVGIKFGSHDAGGGSYWADLYGVRARCVNFTKIVGSRKLGRVRHAGDVETLRERVRELIALGTDALKDFSECWADANQQAIIDGALGGDGDVRDVFRALIRAGYVDAPGGEDAAVDAYHNAWLAEPGHTRADICNAITRAAHEAPWSSPWVSDTLEEQAGQLLYQRVVLTEERFRGLLDE